MALQRLSLTRGDNAVYDLQILQSDGTTPYCIKNWVIFFTAKSDYSLPDSAAAFQKIVTSFPDSTAGTSGSAQIVLEPSDTANLEPGLYKFDIAVTTNEDKNYTILTGVLDLGFDVTQSIGTAGTL